MLPLTIAPGGYLRLFYKGPVGVNGAGVQQSWDLTALSEGIRSNKDFKSNLLIFVQQIAAGVTAVSSTVAFFPAVGTPTQLILTLDASADADQIQLDVWCLHSILGALSDSPKLYFILSSTFASGVLSVFGRAGVVVAMLGDYAASLITNDSTAPGATVKDALDALATANAADFVDTDGPIRSFPSGAYRTTVGAPFPSSIVWYFDATLAQRLVDLTITRDVEQKPTIEVWQVYEADGVTVAYTFTDSINYSGPFETDRTRVVT